MNLKSFTIYILLVFVTFIFKANAQQKAELTVIPNPYERALRNPLMGFTHSDVNHPWASTTHTYIKWNELENHESDGLDKILTVSNQKFANLANTNRKSIPRVYLHWSQDDQKYWPTDMQTDDYTSEQFQHRVVRLIERLGLAWDNDPRVAFIEMGIFGKWGEQHGPSPTAAMQNLVGDAFASAFHNKKVSVRHVWNEFTQHPFGEYWDSWAHYDQMWPHGKSIHNVNATKQRYLENYIGGEVAYNWGNWEIQPGATPTASVAIENHRDFMINSIRWLHCTQLRWIAGYDRNHPTAAAGAEKIQKAFGYRFVLNEVRISMSDSLSVSFDVTNEGSAPFYYDWPVEVSLLNINTLQPVWKSVMENADIRKWHPGSEWTEPEWTNVGGWRQYIPHINWNSSGITGWANPPQKNTVKEKFIVNAPAGNYILALAILDPSGMQPSVKFATANYINGGRHPIAVLNTVNKKVEELPSTFQFNDPFNDKSLYYDPTINNATRYSITTSDLTNGYLIFKPGGGTYVSGTEVSITAVGDLGYTFESWGGDLSGSTENPVTIKMDSDKTISATFTSAPIVKLFTESENGTIVLDPPGSIYNPGTKVILTAVPASNFVFNSWGGDLSGKTNPETLIMNSDKTVSATFSGKPISSVRIGDCPSRILVTGQSHLLSAIISPADAYDQSVIWSSSNNAVATVDENGLIRAISQGSATITITTKDGGYTNSCNIGVVSSGIPVNSVTISECPQVHLKVDSTYQLSADITPDNAGDLRVNWSSSDETIASVDANGLVTAISQGEVTITVISNLGGLTHECTVNVDSQTNIWNMDATRKFVEVYPNPVSETLFFIFLNSISVNRISIYNLLGQELLSQAIQGDHYEIDIRKLSSGGVLIVKVITDEGIDSFKVIVEQ
jgi:hypothetical protein